KSTEHFRCSLRHAAVNQIQFMRAEASISARQLAEQCGMSACQIEKYIAELKKKGVLQREGARKNGKWKVLLPHI
ncbi:MAG: winged helix-turn-helix transcriptional regulator, partial [Akkermansia sp.]|nr:winged helix-turn-helix transcriptional regulator [Akkermansia sp.]